MGTDPRGPVYSDGARNSIGQWMGPGVVVYLVVHAFLTSQDLALVIAVPLAFYVAFTWQSRYDLYTDALVVRFFWPRRMVVPLAEVALVREARVFPAGEGLFVGRPGKGPLFIRPRDALRLRDLLNERMGPRKPAPVVEQARSRRPQPKRRRGPPRR